VRRAACLLALLVALLALAGCKTEAVLEVQVEPDGGGAVQVAVALDAEAAARSVLYESRGGRTLPVDDLVAAGWTVTGPTEEADGRVWIRAEKPFSQLDQLGSVVAEVAGPDGPFREFVVERSSSFGERSWRFSGTVDLGRGLAGFSDDGVAAVFGGEPLGQPAKVYAAQFGIPLEDAVTFAVVVDLPGDLDNHNGAIGPAGRAAATTAAAPADGADPATGTARVADRGAAVVWNPRFADSGPTTLSAASSTSDLQPQLWRWAGFVVGAIGGLILAYRLVLLVVDRRADRARRPGGLPAGVMPVMELEDEEPSVVPVVQPAELPGRVQPVRRSPAGSSHASVVQAPAAGPTPPRAPGSPGPAPAGGGSGAGLGLIVIETAGALLRPHDVVGDALVPFVRNRGCTLAARSIADRYAVRTVGACDAAEFWASLELSGDPVLLDDAFARGFELSEHVVSFLTQARDRGVTVLAVGDDVPEWTTVYRQRFRLDGLVAGWVCSADLGVRVPHPGLFDAVRRTAPVAPSRAMVIAATTGLLDTAARFGYRTVQYHPGAGDPEGEHPVLRTFAERGRSGAGRS
jgi:FMN phosphatase YigB (HAD superfamily)